jgi:two-component system, LytTR family, sensor kinase
MPLAVKPMPRRVVVLLHVGYWAMYLLLLAFVFAVVRGQSRTAAPLMPLYAMVLASRVGFQLVVPNVLAFYVMYVVLVPRLLARRRLRAMALGTLLVALGASGVSMMALWGVAGARAPIFISAAELTAFTVTMSGLALIHMTIAMVIRGFVGWYDDIAVKDELRRHAAEVETALIRATLDPHFLFNTLNNIDVLITRDASAASRYLNQLSEIMRYVLYESRTERVALDAEWSFVDKYVALQRIRLSNPAAVRCTLEGDTRGWRIAPMTLMPFVENAFKHAAGQRADDAIIITCATDGATLRFTCANRHQRGESAAAPAGGLGNDLMRRRLALLYPGRHTLETSDLDGTYRVQLSLQLDAPRDDRALPDR